MSSLIPAISDTVEQASMLNTLEHLTIPAPLEDDLKGIVRERISSIQFPANMSLTTKADLISFAFAPTKKRIQWALKRVFDLTASLLGILALMPMFLIVAMLIKLDSKGPIFFKQERVGMNGKTFYMYKFRTMRQDADAMVAQLTQYNETNNLMFKMKNDPRITRIGRFLRKYSIDEFPQLINVVKGEMSLVGPRPPLVREVMQYEDWHLVRFATLPGMTGLWQVSGRSDIVDFDSVVELDFRYIHDWKLISDFAILSRTIPAVLSASGAA